MDEERIRNVSKDWEERQAGRQAGRHLDAIQWHRIKPDLEGSQETDSSSHRTHRTDDNRGCLHWSEGSAAESHAADVSRFNLPSPTERRTPFSQVSG
jgi:hypothetical protein